jgi:hypothetical protein
MRGSSQKRLLGGLSIAAVLSACATLMGVEEASFREADASAPESGATSSPSPLPNEGDGIGADACAGEGCPCADDSECRNAPYRKCVEGKCAECTTEPDSCSVGQYCAAEDGKNRCRLGCKSDDECATLSPSAPKCQPTRHQCVQCVGNGDCPIGKQCSPSGTCADTCTADGGTCADPTKTCCGGLCVDVNTDIFNCKECGIACSGTSPLCCSGTCKDSATAIDACGSCTKTCRATSGTPVCSEGKCLPASCADVLLNDPTAGNGVYLVDPDGPGGMSPFSVYCEMTTAGGGWILVGRELPKNTGHLRFLGFDTNNPTAIAAGTDSGIIGTRFRGRYRDVWIAWGDGLTKYIRFRRPNDFDLFENRIGLRVSLSNFDTNDPTLRSWIPNPNDARLCVATRYNTNRPGDTSWAIKPRDDDKDNCGCNDAGWKGRGAFYGGTSAPDQTACDGWGGGWAGVRDNGQQKGGIVPTYETRIYVR